jgi:hypothetical protein
VIRTAFDAKRSNVSDSPTNHIADWSAFRAFICSLTYAHATWKPEYAALPQKVRDWYKTRELTPAARLRLGFKSCCDNSDVVKTQFKVGGAGNDEWYWLDGNTWRRVPSDVIHWDERAPNGEAVLFSLGSRPTCFFPPGSGN